MKVELRCPNCGSVLQHSIIYVPKEDVKEREYDVSYVQQIQSYICPKCGHRVEFSIDTGMFLRVKGERIERRNSRVAH